MSIENDALAAKVANATGSLGKALDEIIDLLSERGYLRGDRLTGDGKMLARIWSESDLVVAECLRRGTWDALDQADLAAVVSSLVFESRRESLGAARTPSGSAAAGPAGDHPRLGRDRRPGTGARACRRPGIRMPGSPPRSPTWCRGSTLAEAMAVAVAGGTELSAGDFVRWCRQVIDLLDQIGGVAPGARRAHGPIGRRCAAPGRGVHGRACVTACRAGHVDVTRGGWGPAMVPWPLRLFSPHRGWIVGDVGLA